MEINQENIALDLPSMNAFNSYVEALQEGFYRGMQPIKTAEEIEQIKADPQAHFAELNDNSPGKFEAPSGETFQKVPYENLWLVEGDNFIGEVSFRHELNQLLEDFGGHVGYGIRPSLTGKGFATLALNLTKRRAAKMNIEKLMLTCSPNNLASERVIQKNGGVFIDVSANTHGYNRKTHRYWVPTRD